MSDHDESKLPKWAQDKLQQQRRTIRELAHEIDALRGDLEQAPEDWPDDGFRLVLRRGMTSSIAIPLTMYRPKVQTPHGYAIDLQARPDGLGVRTVPDSGQPHDTMQVMPQAANYVVLDALGRHSHE